MGDFDSSQGHYSLFSGSKFFWMREPRRKGCCGLVAVGQSTEMAAAPGGWSWAGWGHPTAAGIPWVGLEGWREVPGAWVAEISSMWP